MRACVHDSEEELVVPTSNANHCSQAVVSPSVDCDNSALCDDFISSLFVLSGSGCFCRNRLDVAT